MAIENTDLGSFLSNAAGEDQDARKVAMDIDVYIKSAIQILIGACLTIFKHKNSLEVKVPYEYENKKYEYHLTLIGTEIKES